MIQTLAVAAALAGAILLAPVAQAQLDSSTGLDHSNAVANTAAILRKPTVAGTANKFMPTTTAAPFGARGTFVRQPGLAIAMANGINVVTTRMPVGFATPIVKGDMVVSGTTIRPLSGGIRTRHGRS